MTTRSGISTTDSSVSIPREDGDVYTYTLRVAVLTSNLALEQQQPSQLKAGNALAASTSKPGHSRHSSSRGGSSLSSGGDSGWRDSLMSLTDVFGSKDKNGKSVRFPKEFVRAFEQKIDRVATGADRSYSHAAQGLEASLTHYSKVYKQPTVIRKLKDNRQVEEVILMFVTTASQTLKKDPTNDRWKTQLNEQVIAFVKMIRDTLRSKDCSKSASPELMNRLDTYCNKLDDESATKNDHLGGDLLQSTSRLTIDPNPVPGLTTNVHDMPLVLAAGQLFGKTQADLTKDVVSLRRQCSEKAAFTDLKACINNVAKQARFPARREDFDSDDAYSAWRKQETDELQELILDMIKRNPELVTASATDAPRSIEMSNGQSTVSSNRSSLVVNTTDYFSNASTPAVSSEEDLTDSFYFVPPDPKFYFKRLFEIALDHDYEAMRNLPPDEDVALTILSQRHEDLLRECQLRWRISRPFRATTFLSLITQYYREQGVPEACVGEALNGLARVNDRWEYDRWPWQERQIAFKKMSALFDILLTRFFEVFQGILDLPFYEIVDLLETIYANEIFSEDARDLAVVFEELKVGMRKFVRFACEEKQADVDSLPRPHDLQPFLLMLDWITAETKGYDKHFPRPVLGAIDVPAIFISVAAPEFVRHLDASRTALLAAASQAEGAATDADLLDLYRGIIELQKMHNAFCPETQLVIDFSAWFEPYVRRWLAMTDTKTMEWVKRAIAHDKFSPEGEDKHSSSIVDLIDSCKSATDFILKLKWPDEYENARYLTCLSQTIAKSIEQYSNQLEGLFLQEMFPRKEGRMETSEVARPSQWLTKARLVVQGDKKVEPFVFQPESCVKLNNIQAARKLLDTMYTTLDADKVSQIVQLHAPPMPEREGDQRFLFTVKIVLGENLLSPDGSRSPLDPFLILSDPSGHRVAKTRTLYETNDPRWDETIDVSVRGDLWLRATVYHRNLVERHDMIGFAYIHLHPAEYGDFLARDVWLRLEDSAGKPLEGRLLLRISMEGEKDDIQFYFGRAFRSLKRAENDMARIIVDKMSPFVRHYLSRNSLKSLVKRSYGFDFDIDLDKVRGEMSKVTGKVSEYVRDALGSEPVHYIPPVKEEMSAAAPSSPTATRKKGRAPLTDQEIEDAIGDLFDYFNVTFTTLHENLSSEAWELVIGRLWKDILLTIEGLIVPPLSDQPTDMRLLSDKEVDIVFKWLGFLVSFFHNGGQGVPIEDLRNAKYRELVEARMYYDWKPDQLMEEAVRSMQRQLIHKSGSIVARSKSVFAQRNSATIRARKIEKKQQAQPASGEMILRILRMHSGTTDFLSTQISTMLRVQAEQAKTTRGSSLQRRNLSSSSTSPTSTRPSSGLGANRAQGRFAQSRLARSTGAGGSLPPSIPPIPEAYRQDPQRPY